jgi:hypothetical protein
MEVNMVILLGSWIIDVRMQISNTTISKLNLGLHNYIMYVQVTQFFSYLVHDFICFEISARAYSSLRSLHMGP